jgi:hypothetical protein
MSSEHMPNCLQWRLTGISPEKSDWFGRLFGETWRAIPAEDQALLSAHWEQCSDPYSGLPAIRISATGTTTTGNHPACMLEGGRGIELNAGLLCKFPDDRSICIVFAEELAHNLCFALGKVSHVRPLDDTPLTERHQEMESDAQQVLFDRWKYVQQDEYGAIFKRLEGMKLYKP